VCVYVYMCVRVLYVCMCSCVGLDELLVCSLVCLCVCMCS